MIKKAIILGIAGILLIGSVVYAIATPATYLITQANAYRHGVENDDQLWIIVFNLDYAANPDETANEAWLVRLLDDADNEIEAVAPYAYHNDGYELGIVAFYFEAADADIPTWSDNFTLELAGNPSLSWDAGDPPKSTNTAITWSSSATIGTTSSEVTARVRYLAGQIDTATGQDLIAVLASEQKLTSAGEDYFTTSIENLRIIAPDLFSTAIIAPEFPERTYTQAEATTVESRWVGDPLLDLSGLATLLGVSRMWITSVFWIIFVMLICWLVTRKVEDFRPVAFLFTVLLVVGAAMSFMPYVTIAIAGVACLVGLVYVTVWSGAT